jgi:tetratricopeptide (TPR) repeat protein
MSLNPEVSIDLVDDLLSLPTRGQRSAFLRDVALLDAEGLDRLLDVADRLASADPGKARRLAELCADAADDADAPAAMPRAAYIRAHTHAENGEFDAALRLVNLARDRYVALGEKLEALRTNVGLMAILLELGLYDESLGAGQMVLDTLDGKGELDARPTPQEADLLTALVHQNRGACYEHMGRYEEALSAWTSAKEIYQARGMTERVGEISDSQGVVLRYLGRGNEALSAHEAAAAVFERAGLHLSHAMALGNIGEAHLQLGNYTSGLEAFERARRLLDSLDALVNKHVLLLDTANTYLALNLYPEALAAYREANELLQNAGMTYEHARGLWGMGSALTAQFAFEKAEQTLVEAETLFAAVDNAPLLSGVMLEQAALRAARGDRTTALETARRALTLVTGSDWPVQQVYAHLRLADLLLPDATEAEPHLREAQRLADRLALPQLRYRLNERFGRLRRLQGRDEEARELLESAIDEIERLRGTVAQDAVRASFLRDKTAAYEDLLQLYLAQGDEGSVWRAFAVAERAKSRALADLLAGVTEKGPELSGDPELENRLQTLQADLNAIYNRLLGATDDREDRASYPDLRARAISVEQEISRLRLQAAVASEVQDPFVEFPSLDDAREQIPRDATLLAFHVIGDEIMAFVGVRDNVRVVRHLGSVARVRQLLQKLNAQWDRFRAGKEFVNRNMQLLERSAQRILAALHEELMGPLVAFLNEVVGASSDGFGSTRKLVVVPHGPLHHVPFQALFDGQRYLLDRFEISYAPSVRIHALCQNKVAHSRDDALVMSVADPLIPAVSDEAPAVARHFRRAELRNDEQATLSALEAGAPEKCVLHMACHGMFRADNPMFSSLKLHDGWLLAADAMRLNLPGALVTLSACESGRTEVIGGDEVLGLTRAFLGAGAATLVVSLWLVQDETTVELMDGWYGRLREGEERAAALRAAQLELKEKYPHPYYWAPFVLIGKR